MLLFALASVYFWGFLAHGYGFLHSSFSHDSLNEFAGKYGSNSWKVQLGRFFIPLYKAIFRTDLTLPWLIGILSMVWIGLSVFLVVRLFRMKSRPVIFLLAGIFTTNVAVTATAATFMHDVDGNMFALLCACAAVCCWKKLPWGSLPGAVLVAVCLGIYQSYLSVTVVLVIFLSILELMDGRSFKSVMLPGLKAIGMILMGCVLYYLLLKTVLSFTGISLATGESNSLGQLTQLPLFAMPSLIYSAYVDCAVRLLWAVSPYPGVIGKGIVLTLGVIMAAAAVTTLLRRDMGILEKCLFVVLLGLIPLGMNFTYILTFGSVHDLMAYAVWLYYFFALLLADRLSKEFHFRKDWLSPKYLSLLLVAVFLYGNVQSANVAYLKKDMEQESFLSFMTRVLYRIEACEDYEPGVTPVVFVGTTDQMKTVLAGFEDYTGITGLSRSAVSGTTEEFRVRNYFHYVLNNPANIPYRDHWERVYGDPRVREMPCYPAAGSVAMVGDTLVVKLSNE